MADLDRQKALRARDRARLRNFHPERALLRPPPDVSPVLRPHPEHSLLKRLRGETAIFQPLEQFPHPKDCR